VRLDTADIALSTSVVVYAVAPKYHVPLARLLTVEVVGAVLATCIR